MRFLKPLLILASASAGLTLATGDKGPNCTPTKAQQILRQKVAELNTTTTLPTKAELLNDLQRLHREGKISDQQLEAFKKNINEQYSDPGAPQGTDAQLRAQQLLEQRLAESRTQPAAPPPAASQEAQAKAQKVLEQKLPEQPIPAPQPAPQHLLRFRLGFLAGSGRR